MAKALVLLSGGVDSAVCLFKAVRALGPDEVTALTFDWGQLSYVQERKAARALSAAAGTSPPRVVRIRFPYQGVLTGGEGGVPLDRTVGQIEDAKGVAPTFFPGRNLVMLAHAFGQAYVQGAERIYFGAGREDTAGYPDCRPDFVEAIQSAGNLALGGTRIEVLAPLIGMSKAEIISAGEELGVPWELTFSCYAPVEGGACGRCDACTLRLEAFRRAGVG